MAKKEYTLETIKAPKDIFRRILKAIKAEPERHDQSAWHLLDGKSVNDEEQAASCDTVHCVGGWGVVLTPGALSLQFRQVSSAGYLFNRALFNAGRFNESLSAGDMVALYYDMDNEEALDFLTELADRERKDERNAKARKARRAARRVSK